VKRSHPLGSRTRRDLSERLFEGSLRFSAGKTGLLWGSGGDNPRDRMARRGVRNGIKKGTRKEAKPPFHGTGLRQAAWSEKKETVFQKTQQGKKTV